MGASKSINKLKILGIGALIAAVTLLVGALGVFASPQQAVASDLQAGSTVTTQDTKQFIYTIGKKKSNRINSYFSTDEHSYIFTVPKGGCDVNYRFANTSTSSSASYLRFYLYKNDYDYSFSSIYKYVYAKGKETGTCYLPEGEYTLSISTSNYYSAGAKYSIQLSKVKHKAKLKSKKGTITSTTKTKTIDFTYNGSYEFANSNFSVVAKNKKVAYGSITLDSENVGKGTLSVTPLALGKTVIRIKSNKTIIGSYTVSVTKKFAYVAKGTTSKLAKPLGVKSVKFSMKKNARATLNSKNGKLTAKKQGRVVVNAKSGKTTYTYNVVITDYAKLARSTYKLLQENVPNPNKMSILSAYYGYNQTIMANEKKLPVVYLDYTFLNENGGWSRNKILAYYDDALDAHYVPEQGPDNIMKKKSFTAAQIKAIAKR